MIRSMLSLLASPDVLPALALFLKVSVLLVAGMAAAALLRNASASARHLVWMLCLISCAAVMVFAPFAPRLAIPVELPSAAPLPLQEALPQARSEVPVMPAVEVAQSAQMESVRTTSSAKAATESPRPVGETMVIIWAIGCVLVLIWSVLGHVALIRLRRFAHPLNDVAWQSLAQGVAVQLGVTRRVQLVESEAMRTPVTWGLRAPVILFPAGVSLWSEDRKRVVLMHEMAHIARRDYAWQCIAGITSALFWYHPGVWLAARRLRMEAERACDDAVLAAGMSGVDYAAHLLDVARRMRVMRLIGPAAVGMARPSHLEERLLAVLTSLPSRRPVASNVARLAVALTLLAVIPVAGVRTELAARTVTLITSVNPPQQADSLARVSEPASPVRNVKAGVPATPIARRGQDRWDINDSIAAPNDGELDLDLSTGATLDIRGWDKPFVRVRGTLRGPDVGRTRLNFGPTKRGAWLRTRMVGTGSFETSHTFEIRVPADFSVHIQSAGGGVTLTDLTGEFHGTTGGGALVLDHLSGRAVLSTGGGDIHVTNSDLSGRVSTGGGSVIFSGVKGGLRGSSGSGPVVYSDDDESGSRTVDVSGNRTYVVKDDSLYGRLKKAAEMADSLVSGTTVTTSRTRESGVRRGRHSGLSISKAGGDVDLASAPEGAYLYTGGGRIRVGRSGGLVDATTGGGDITLGPIAGSAAAQTGAGDVHITIVDSNGEQHDIDVTSGSGKVVLELPSSIDAEFELETAYTNNHRGKTQIVSDFNLSREETQNWDDSEGTPRRYVRARGTIGSGRSLIRVRTVNGDITVKRTR